MATNQNITTSELDFDAIKSNLKTFLQGQETFKDYDFEGAGLSVLLDVLAYNTHYNALYTNLAVNESFLDSASKRSSVVSRAKEIGYIPHSVTAATAYVTITVASTNNANATLTIPAYSQFNTTIAGNTYTFYNTEAIITTRSGTSYTFNNVAIKEGTPLTFKYLVANGTQFIIPNTNVDLSTLKVRVQDNSTSSVFNTFVNQEEILNLDATSQVYFVKEIEGQLYELQFGNDVVGKGLKNGNIVNLTYMTTNKTVANGAKLFTYQGGSLDGGTVSVTTLTPASGGTELESIDSIRYNAPRSYTAQNRAVTVEDYKALIYKLFPEAQSINAWGGEDNVPKMYGKIFLSIKPKTTDLLTESQIQLITQDILKQKNVVSITPEIVNPEYINLQVDTTFYYNPRLTSRSESELKDLVTTTINDYNNTYLNSFTGVFKYSKLSSMIDAAEQAITSNITTVKLHREVEVQYNINALYTINLGNPIYYSGAAEQSILSTGFYVYGYTDVMRVEDLPGNNSTGVLRLFYYNTSGDKVYVRNLGSIDYTTGTITMDNLNITGIDLASSSIFELIIKPQSNDVVSVRNQLVTIPTSNVTVKAVLDSVSMGDAAGGSSYIFTSSRN